MPNVGWDSTPRRSEDGPGWGSAKNRRWDAPTPRASRGGSPDENAPVTLDMREWEEEQIRLDRDWYMGPEEGNMAGDEDFNPLAQYEDLGAAKQKELATRAVVRVWCLALLIYANRLHTSVEEDIRETSAIQRGQRSLGSEPNAHIRRRHPQDDRPRL